MKAFFSPSSFQKLSWRAPYQALAAPIQPEACSRRLGGKKWDISVEGDLLTFICRSKTNLFQLPDWLNIPFHNLPEQDLWIAQARMRDWDRAFFRFQAERGEGEWQRFYAPHAPKPPTRAKQLRGVVQEYKLPSKALGEERPVTVYLPPNAPKGISVVYMADGQSAASFAAVLEPMILARKVRPTAIVGFHAGRNTNTDGTFDLMKDFRMREYLKVLDPDRFGLHLQFVCDEILPWAEAKFDVSSKPEDRVLFGFSNGGAFALTATADRPSVFGFAFPYSVAAFDRATLRATLPDRPSTRYLFAAGSLESFIVNTQDAHDILCSKRGNGTIDRYITGHENALWELAFTQHIPQIFPLRG